MTSMSLLTRVALIVRASLSFEAVLFPFLGAGPRQPYVNLSDNHVVENKYVLNMAAS